MGRVRQLLEPRGRRSLAAQPGHCYRLAPPVGGLGVYDGQAYVILRHQAGGRLLARVAARPLEDLGALPAGIEARQALGIVDARDNRPVAFDRPVSEGGRGWYHLDDGGTDPGIDPWYRPNRPLFLELSRRLAAEGA
jgi:hypothetical protein